jgi:peptide/nickel transport system substrate-binding protein
VFNNLLTGKRKEAMDLCMKSEGNVDIVSRIRPLDTLKVALSPYAKIVKSRDVTWPRGLYNMRKNGSIFKDIRVRKALNYALNREEVRKFAAKGNAYNIGGCIPHNAFGHNPDVKPFHYDTETARGLLAEAGLQEGVELKILAPEMLELEARLICNMLERIEFKPTPWIVTDFELMKKTFVSVLERAPEEVDWDIVLYSLPDLWANTGLSFLPWGFIQAADCFWIEYDPVYEKMWRDVISNARNEDREDRIREMVNHLYDQSYALFIYSPITLYAVNKEVDFVPYKSTVVRLKETSVTDNHWSIRCKEP